MTTVAAPYTIEQAVADEQAFWRQIRGMLRDEVLLATADAVMAMKTVAANQTEVVARVNGIASQVASMASTVTRLENVITAKSLLDNQLREKLGRLLNMLESRPTPPHVPAKENGGHSP